MSKISFLPKTSAGCSAGGLGVGDTWVADQEGKGTWSGVWLLGSQGRVTVQSVI